jgi:hypothetical protein
MIFEYKPADKYCTVNLGDEDITPIVYGLPNPPDYKLIDGYGKEPVNQKWEVLKLPPKLRNLEDKAVENVRAWSAKRSDRRVTEYRVLNEFWDLLENEKKFYKEEIEYIRRIHFYLHYGYWFFIYGKPTWIPPTYFRYLNFWHYPDIPGNKPHYRDVDRRTYIHKWYCRTTHETLGNLNSDGIAQKDENGSYVVLRSPVRTVFGHIKPKRRREGATNQECSDMLWTAERNFKGDCVIMADKGQSAQDIFKDYMMTGWMAQPLFLKPINDTYQNSSEIKFMPPSQEYKVKSMMSTISYIDTAGEGGVDRMKLYGVFSDESAKLTRSDASRRHGVSKYTTAQGRDIHGYMAYPSTVEEMEEGGGEYRMIWDNSDFYKRDAFGNTISGLLRIFTPAWDGYDHYIDAWGYSVIDNPTRDQIKYAPPGALYLDGVGAKQILEQKVSQLLRDGTPAALKEYREFIRKNPFKVQHCWMGTAGDLGFNTVKVDQRIAELYRNDEGMIRGSFRWIGGIRDNPNGVEFVEDRMNGRFYVSNLLIGRQNKMTWTAGATVWDESKGAYVRARCPVDPTVTTAGADSFDYGNRPDTKTHSMMSDGGFHVLLNYDEQKEKDKSKDLWDTLTTICSYRHRPPSLNEFCEDVIMGIVYFGAMLSLERNKSGLWKYIIDRGYGGYLVFMQNSDGTIEKQPGIWTGQGLGSKDFMFNMVRDYINDRIHKEKHVNLLREMKDISSPEKLRHFDLLTAFMCSLVGASHGYQLRFKKINMKTSISLKGTQFAPRGY